MSRNLPIALVQSPGVPASSLEVFGQDLDRLTHAYSASKLFVFPELHLCAPGSGDTPRDHGVGVYSIGDLAEPLQGPRGQMLSAIAREFEVWLVPGSVYELGEDGQVYNTAVVYDPEGRLVASYRKVFPWRPYEKSAPGNRFVVFDMDGFGRIGLSICYDSWFPESTRQLAWMGAELVLNVVRTRTIDRAQEIVLARANAIINQVAFASVNAATPTGLGQSLICDSEGRVRVAATDGAEQVLSDVIDLDEVSRTREYGTAGLNRLWDQLQPNDPPIDLPLYGGSITHDAWSARISVPKLNDSRNHIPPTPSRKEKIGEQQ